MKVARVNVRRPGGWSSWPDVSTPLGMFPAPWAVKEVERGALADVSAAQVVFWPTGDEDITEWLEAWLGRPERHRTRTWNEIANFVRARGPLTHRVVLDLDLGVRGLQVRIPQLVAAARRGVGLVVHSAAIMERDGSRVTFVVWQPPVELVALPSDLAHEQRHRIATVARGVDFGVAVGLRLLDDSESADDAAAMYRYAAAERAYEQHRTFAQLLDEWESDVTRGSLAVDLPRELRELSQLRRALPQLTVGVDMYITGARAGEPDVNRAAILLTRDDLGPSASAFARAAVEENRRLEEALKLATSTLAQLTMSAQLHVAGEERAQSRKLESVLAYLGALVLLPAAVASGIEAASGSVKWWVVVAAMFGSAVLTGGALMLVRR